MNGLLGEETETARPIPRGSVIRACRVIAESLDPVSRAKRPFAHRDIETAFLYGLHPEIESWWIMNGPSVHDAVLSEHPIDEDDAWAVIAAAIHVHRLLDAPLDQGTITELSIAAAARLMPPAPVAPASAPVPPPPVPAPIPPEPPAPARKEAGMTKPRERDVVMIARDWREYGGLLGGVKGTVTGVTFTGRYTVTIVTTLGDTIEVKVPAHRLRVVTS